VIIINERIVVHSWWPIGHGGGSMGRSLNSTHTMRGVRLGSVVCKVHHLDRFGLIRVSEGTCFQRPLMLRPQVLMRDFHEGLALHVFVLAWFLTMHSGGGT
jgi:hypothetical protein